jgi:hypothetical protein
VLPEEGDAERPEAPSNALPRTLRIINISGDDFGTKLGEVLRLVRCGASRQRACGEITASIAQIARTRRRGIHNCDNLFFCHSEFSAAGPPFGIDRVQDDKRKMRASNEVGRIQHTGERKAVINPGFAGAVQLPKVAVEAHTLGGPETLK